MALYGKIPGATSNHWNFGYSDFERILSCKISPILDELLKNSEMEDRFLNIKLTKGGSIKQKEYHGKFHSEYGLPIMDVDILSTRSGKKLKGLKAFIDTGGSHTIVNRNILTQLDYNDTDFVEKAEMSIFSGQIKAKMVSDITIVSDLVDFHTINYVVIGEMNEFDIAIGNDVLQTCQLNYDGLGRTFTLKSFVVD